MLGGSALNSTVWRGVAWRGVVEISDLPIVQHGSHLTLASESFRVHRLPPPPSANSSRVVASLLSLVACKRCLTVLDVSASRLGRRLSGRLDVDSLLQWSWNDPTDVRRC